MNLHPRLLLLVPALASLSWVPPVSYVEVASFIPAGNCAISGDRTDLDVSQHGGLTSTGSTYETIYCSVPIGPATVLAEDLDYVRVLVDDLSTAGSVRVELCFMNTSTIGQCGTPASTTTNQSAQTLIALAPTSLAGQVAGAYLKVTLPPHGSNGGYIRAYSLFTH